MVLANLITAWVTKSLSLVNVNLDGVECFAQSVRAPLLSSCINKLYNSAPEVVELYVIDT